ncbi:carboxypeptidase-like regulatory domain-containing protein [Aquiflexum sp. LQ15W]|uniref:carboxypeptidase-like regulatory domain-containing protein n=1 Tax=Cognataquiflexum nitidum TaxID=2922272 RepID=UPI001F1293E6|nr:carboxypeptidase-like regulatory domain-containing protein [Cognataquiflexum nitidum]MCH6198158.1 carboxypeptidase-like regulatory domain-containing protein [Cognataquiflexum nitidum]
MKIKGLNIYFGVCLFIHSLIPGNVFSQKFTVSGVIKDSETSIPLEFVSVYAKNSNLGTFTNENGEFVFHLPNSFKDSLLVFSLIGYKSSIKELSEVGVGEVFTLFRDSYFLDEVVVKEDSSIIIMNKALNSIKSNYPRKQHFLDAFYRETVKKDTTYVRMLEAAVGIQDFSYSSPREKRKAKVYEIRKSDDFVEKGWITKIIEKFSSSRNDLLMSLHLCDFVRRYQQEKMLLYFDTDQEFLEFHEFKLENLSLFEGKEVYEIGIYLPAEIDKGQFGGKFYINKEDFAIVKVEFFSRLPVFQKEVTPAIFNAFISNYLAEYRKVNGTYYLSRIRFRGPENFDSIDPSTFTGYQFFQSDIIVNEVLEKRKEFDRIKNKEKLNDSGRMYNGDFKYNSEFWEQYNVLISSQEYEKIVKDLTKNRSIKEQFKSNSKRND